VESDSILEVGIDAEERLFVRPASATFPYIYREAMEVHWDAAGRRLHSPKPREWTYPRWFQQIVNAAAEQSCELRLTPSTAWVDIPAATRAEIERWSASRDSKEL
jgi:hypothetical protein